MLDALKPKTCPGIPSTVPPDLADYDDPDEGEGESSAAEVPAVRKRTIRFDDGDDGDGKEKVDPADLPPGTAEVDEDGPHVDDVQRRMLRMAGHADVDQYMKEMEEVHRKTQNEKQQEIQNRIAKLDGQQPQEELPVMPLQQQQPPQQLIPPPPPHQPHPAHLHPHMIIPPRGGVPLMYRPAPPPLRPGVAPPGVRLPPGPPPGAPPAAAVGFLPGPPPGRPPMMQTRFPLRPQSVLSAAPQINREATVQAVAAAAAATTAAGPAGAGTPAEKTPSANASGVIEAKPQMR